MLKLKMTNAPVGLAIFMFLIWLYTAISCSWIVNLVQLIRCDFSNQTSWKEEIIHVIGLVPPCSWVTVWL